MNSRQRRKLAAEYHNKCREEMKALELDRKNNPEKYKRKRRARRANGMTKGQVLLAIAATANS